MKKGSEEEWVIGADPEEIHELLCLSDLKAADKSGTQVPIRNKSSSEQYARLGNVSVFKVNGVAIAMFTLTTLHDLTANTKGFPAAENPVQLTRLAVHPIAQDSIIGFKCVKKAIETATINGHDCIRCEVNPKIETVFKMLKLCGFREVISGKMEPINVFYLYKVLI